MQIRKIPSQGSTAQIKTRNSQNKHVQLKNKSVSFNILDDNQKEIYDYAASKSNFSGYIKGLILKDMLRHTKGVGT